MSYYEDFETHINNQLDKVNSRLDKIRVLEGEVRDNLMNTTLVKVDSKTKEIVEIRRTYKYEKLLKQQRFLSRCLFLNNQELELLVSDIENAKIK